MSNGLFSGFKKAGQKSWHFVSWLLAKESFPEVSPEILKREIGKKGWKSFFAWVFEPEKLPALASSANGQNTQEPAVSFSRWVFGADDLPPVRPGNGLDDMTGKKSSFLRWVFASETLPNRPLNGPEYNKSFAKWVLESDDLPEVKRNEKELS